ncbi:MAG: patatin-like phospholipase family protein [Chitinophagaceae bacterium]|nr:patatin-like phospholipase family protein [Chitinophagaceae bacterium]
MKALVISGGGSKGAFAGGVSEFLIRECKQEYDIFIGTSAGSLLIPLLAIDQVEKIKDIFTSVSQNDIFNINPFIIEKRNGIYETSINHRGIIKMFLRRRKTFGESLNLRKLIGKILTENDFKLIKNGKPDVIITVSNISYNRVEYKSVKECTYEDFCDWIWASANVIPFMSLLNKNGFEYADGGLGNVVPLFRAIEKGATEIDVIVLKAANPMIQKNPVQNALELTARAFDFMLNQIETDDITIGRMEGIQHHVTLNFYQPTEDLTTNSLIFEPEKMKKWWANGYDYAKQNNPKCRTIKPKDKS